MNFDSDPYHYFDGKKKYIYILKIQIFPFEIIEPFCFRKKKRQGSDINCELALVECSRIKPDIQAICYGHSAKGSIEDGAKQWILVGQPSALKIIRYHKASVSFSISGPSLTKLP